MGGRSRPARDHEEHGLYTCATRNQRYPAIRTNRHDQCGAIYALLCLGKSGLHHGAKYVGNQLGAHRWRFGSDQKVLGRNDT